MSELEIIPAIDLMGGCCVRLKRGRREEKTVYSKHPGCVARQWERQGAKRLHIVDLDGAFEGCPINLKFVERILRRVSIPVELGGGLRTIENVRCALKMGVQWAILGTRAFRDFEFLKQCIDEFGERIILGLDAKEGRISGEGWLKDEGKDAISFIKSIESLGVSTLIYTDIHRDGMLTGPNIEATRMLCATTKMNVIASGGISSLEDLIALKELVVPNLIGAVVGRALYTADIDLKKTIEALAAY